VAEVGGELLEKRDTSKSMNRDKRLEVRELHESVSLGSYKNKHFSPRRLTSPSLRNSVAAGESLFSV
jgi:hypothetical protein